MTTIEIIREEILEMKKDIKAIKEAVDDEAHLELSDEAEAALEKARGAPRSDYREV